MSLWVEGYMSINDPGACDYTSPLPYDGRHESHRDQVRKHLRLAEDKNLQVYTSPLAKPAGEGEPSRQPAARSGSPARSRSRNMKATKLRERAYHANESPGKAAAFTQEARLMAQKVLHEGDLNHNRLLSFYELTNGLEATRHQDFGRWIRHRDHFFRDYGISPAGSIELEVLEQVCEEFLREVTAAVDPSQAKLSVIGNSLDQTLALLEDSRKSFEEVLRCVGQPRGGGVGVGEEGGALCRKASPARGRTSRLSNSAKERYQNPPSRTTTKAKLHGVRKGSSGGKPGKAGKGGDDGLRRSPEQIMSKLQRTTEELAALNDEAKPPRDGKALRREATAMARRVMDLADTNCNGELSFTEVYNTTLPSSYSN